MKSTIIKIATFFLALTLGAAAYAGENYGAPQEADPAQAPAPQTQPAATNFSDGDLEKFAAVQADLESIREEYAAKLEKAGDPDEAAALQQEASQTMVQAVQGAGLDVETYSQIAQAVRADPALRERVMEMMN